VRRKLPDERESITHKFSIGGHEGYITVGKYEDGTPGEIFITMAKEGSTISGLMDSFATMTSISLQHGVPLQLLVDKFTHTRFEPSGFTKNPEIPMAKSIMDYIFKWLAIKFLSRDSQEHAGVILRDREGARNSRGSPSRLSPLIPRPSERRRHAPRAQRRRTPPQDNVPGPGRRAQLQRLRLDHGEERGVLQVFELR
jgi:ribonucleoside-diphosphate reductase alpha chain